MKRNQSPKASRVSKRKKLEEPDPESSSEENEESLKSEEQEENSTEWKVTLPKRKADGSFVFASFPEFQPNLSPKEILQAGAFGGTYFRPIQSAMTGKTHKDDWHEFPADWFEDLKPERHMASSVYHKEINKYKVKSGTSLEDWEKSGWIKSQDPRGWFQWYCRFYLGRRTSDDQRQVDRWLKICGPNGRWKQNLIAKCVQKGGSFDDESVSPVVRQTLHHWAYTLTEKHFDPYAKRIRAGANAPYIKRK